MIGIKDNSLSEDLGTGCNCLLTSLFILLMMPFQAVNAEKKSAGLNVSSQDKVFTVVVPREFPPHYLVDDNDKPIGFAVDVFNEVAIQANLKFVYVVNQIP